MKKYKELEIVTVKGTIVAVYSEGKAYEVELVGEDGRTIALFTISHKDLERMNI